MKTKPDRDLNIIGDFIKYTLILFVPFFLLGVFYCLINGFSLIALLFNPLTYSIGISSIIIVISYDINDILKLIGRGQDPPLRSHIKYSKEVQEISVLMSMHKYDQALTRVNSLIEKDRDFAAAHNMRGEILFLGFHKNKEARECFNTVLKLAKEDDEQYKLAEAMKAATYTS